MRSRPFDRQRVRAYSPYVVATSDSIVEIFMRSVAPLLGEVSYLFGFKITSFVPGFKVVKARY